MPVPDHIDRRLLHLLQERGRISQLELAQAVGLSSPAVADRLRKLEERGFIRGFTVLLDSKKLGWDVTAFIFVNVDGSRYYPDFIRSAQECPEVLECHAVTGQGSHILKVRVASTTALEHLLAEVQSWPGVHGTQSSVVLSTSKETLRVPRLEQGDEGD